MFYWRQHQLSNSYCCKGKKNPTKPSTWYPGLVIAPQIKYWPAEEIAEKSMVNDHVWKTWPEEEGNNLLPSSSDVKEWANIGTRDLQTLRHIFRDLGQSEDSCCGVFSNRYFYWMACTKACKGDFVTVDFDLGGRNRQRS